MTKTFKPTTNSQSNNDDTQTHCKYKNLLHKQQRYTTKKKHKSTINTYKRRTITKRNAKPQPISYKTQG